MYQKVNTNLNFVDREKKVEEFWKENHIFEKSMENRKEGETYTFYDGPPTANGKPHIGHVLTRVIKDMIPRYRTMKGYMVPRKAGWDTHGLPVELEVEKKLGLDGKEQIEEYGMEPFIKQCKESVWKYKGMWEDFSSTVGFWADMEHPYVTYYDDYIESEWWALKEIWNKKLLYKGFKIVPYCPRCGTPLSAQEVSQGYKTVKERSAVVRFKVVGEDAYFLAWTTTPWTLPSNVALCVNPDETYCKVKAVDGYTYYMAEALLDKVLGKLAKEEGEKAYEVLETYKGTDLEYKAYEPLFACAGEAAAKQKKKAHFVTCDNYVTMSDGTGIVHIAPTFGADDAKVAKDANIPALYLINKKGETRPMVDLQGKFYLIEDLDANFVNACVNKEAYAHHAGDYVKNAYDPQFNVDGVWDKKASEKAEDLNIVLCYELKQEGKAFKSEKHVHNYPHCWRTDKPILYYPLDSWFIKDTARKERMVELNKTINWQPESTGTGRFGNWLENLNDWNLSRSRFWGTPLPIWRDENRGEKCIGSLEELYAEIEKSVAAGIMQSNPLKENGFVPGDYSQENYDKIDLHRPYVDKIVLVNEEGKPMYRESDLIDVWFDSGSMPYAQLHYPFEGEMARGTEADRDALIHSTYEGYAIPPKFYPADFINEGVDQTRGWFFTLHAIATMVFDSVAFKNVISSGLVLDAKGNKMSKHVGNVTNPFEMIDKYGADPVRFYMMTNSEPWDNLKFDPNGVDETRRKFFGTLYNTYSFFALYANVDGFDAEAAQVPFEKRPEIDRWILSSLNTLIKGVDRELAGYDPTRAGRLIDAFVNDDLSNWYVRLNRKRFWGKEMSEDKLSAYQTLYTCLMTVAKLLAPFAPFYADELYHDLGGELESVHLDKFPVADEAAIDADLEERMAIAQKITSMVLALRRKVNIKVRQPLQQIMIPAVDDVQKAHIEAVAGLLKNEVNVKEVNFIEGQGILVKKVKCNFRVMGKKFGKLMKGVAAQMSALDQDQIAAFEKAGNITLNIDGQEAVVEVADVEIISEDIPGWLVSNEGNLTVALEVELTPELKKEGMARELINRIQNLRKETGLEITDRINVTVAPNEETDAAIEAFADYIKGQVLADSIEIGDNAGVETEFDDFKLNILVEKN